MSMSLHLRTEALPGPFGVYVDGIDVGQASDDAFAALVTALYANHVIVIRDQHLSPEDYVAFGRRWGELVPYFQQRWTLPGTPEILLITNEAVPGRALPPAENWHADGTYSTSRTARRCSTGRKRRLKAARPGSPAPPSPMTRLTTRRGGGWTAWSSRT